MPKFAMRDPNTGTMVPLLGGVDEATADATFLPKTGGTTGVITAPAPTQPNHAATKYYADHWFPVGTISGFSGNYVPQGWLHCNGQAISRTYYAELFAVCGVKFGAGDGTTFNLPDCRDRAPAAIYGYSGMDYLGAMGGAFDVQIQRTHMPGASGTFYFWNGGHRTCVANTYGGTGATWTQQGVAQYGNPQYAQTGAYSQGIMTIDYGGTDGYHTNVQPSMTMHFMIKY
jgi:microcystin-dependent protein